MKTVSGYEAVFVLMAIGFGLCGLLLLRGDRIIGKLRHRNHGAEAITNPKDEY